MDYKVRMKSTFPSAPRGAVRNWFPTDRLCYDIHPPGSTLADNFHYAEMETVSGFETRKYISESKRMRRTEFRAPEFELLRHQVCE